MAGGGRIKGITIEINGDTTGLQNALKGVDTSLKNTQTQLRDVNKLLKMDPSNAELLRQKQELLNKAIEDTKKRQDQLKKALADAKESGSTQYSQEQQDALQRELIETTQKLKSLEEESKKFGSVAAQQAAVFGEKMKDAGEKLSGVGKTMTATATAPIVGFFTLAANSASDLEENLNKVDVAFGNDAEAVKAWAENATAQFGLSKNAALEATSLFGDMGTAMGLTTGDAATMSTELAGLAGDLSSFKNVDIETAMNALKGVFTGETESLKSLGIIMNQTNLKAFAEDMGLVYDEMSQAELVTLRYNYVLDATKNAQGDYARTSDGTANSIRTLMATISNLTAELGSALLPIITPIIQKITEWAKKFSNLDEGTKNTIVTVGLIVAAIGPLLTVIGTLISLVGSALTLAPAISAAMAALTGPIGAVIAIVAVLGVQFYKNFDKIKAVTKMLLDNIKKAFADIQKTMTTAITNAWNAVKNTFTNIQNFVTSSLNTVKTTVTNAFNTIKTTITNVLNSALSTVSSIFNGIKSTISSLMSGALSVVQSVIGSIKGAFNFSVSLPAIGTAALDVARSAVSGVVNTIKGFFNFSWSLPRVATSAVDGLIGTISGIVSRIRGLFNFSWSLPTLKVPHVRVNGGKAPWGIGGMGTPPSFDVQWYKKAYDNGVLFTSPTVIPTAGGLKGFGDGNGGELVIGVNRLKELIGAGSPTINVYAAPGMDEMAVANAVAIKLDRWLGERI